MVEVIFTCSMEYLEELLGGQGGLVLTRRGSPASPKHKKSDFCLKH